MATIECPECSSYWNQDTEQWCMRCTQRFYSLTPPRKMLKGERIRELLHLSNIWTERTVAPDMVKNRVCELIGRHVSINDNTDWEKLVDEVAAQTTYPTTTGNWQTGQTPKPSTKQQQSAAKANNMFGQLNPYLPGFTPPSKAAAPSHSGTQQQLPLGGFLDDDDDDDNSTPVSSGQPRVHSGPVGGFLDDDDDKDADVPF